MSKEGFYSSESNKENEPQIEAYIDSLKKELRTEIERIIEKEELLGEGRAAKVFTITLEKANLEVCVKVWRPEKQSLPAEERKEFQSITPEEEFRLQDKLYIEGFRSIPRPISFGRYGDFEVMIMEEIKGYTLQEVLDKKVKISNLEWRDLANIIIKLNREHHIAHRDVHPGNIMIETEDDLENNKEIEGEIILIDFGTAKKTLGDPTAEDYADSLTEGTGRVIRYRQDQRAVEVLKPNPRHPEDSPFKS